MYKGPIEVVRAVIGGLQVEVVIVASLLLLLALLP